MKNKIVKIQVLGSGCPSCKKLFELTKQAVEELGITTEVEYVTDIQEIIKLGVMSSPVLTINGKVVLAGSLPKVEKIKELIEKDESKESNINSSDSCSCGGCC
jgi:small redox-active disulfide protein 2